MKLLATVFIFGLLSVGCKKWPMGESVVQITNGTTADWRVSSMGVVRLRSTYSLASGNFLSTCTGTLLHSGDKSFPECVVLSAAHCFKNLPRSTEHSIEFLDNQGRVQKNFRANAVYTHPQFTSTDARVTLEQSAVDISLIKFNCSIPASIKSAKIADAHQVPISTQLIVAGFGLTKSDHALAAENQAKGLGRIVTEDAPMAPQLMQTLMRLQSVDFPSAVSADTNKASPGIFSLQGVNGQGSCDGDSGGPAFYDNGRDLLLVATMSAGPAYCEKATARYTLISPLVSWMEDVLGAGVISFFGRTNAQDKTTTAEYQQKTTPTGSSQTKDSQTSQPIPSELPTALPNANKTPNAVKIAAPLVLPSPKPIQRQTKTNRASSAPKVEVKREVESDSEADLDLDSDENGSHQTEKICEGKKWAANAKTRVWGTVIKLVDKDSTQISDETLKCDFPNESELCFVNHPTATGSGNAKAELLSDVELPGCDKFKSGKTIYIFLQDFLPR